MVQGSNKKTEMGTSKKTKSVVRGFRKGNLEAKSLKLDAKVLDWREKIGKMQSEIIKL